MIAAITGAIMNPAICVVVIIEISHLPLLLSIMPVNIMILRRDQW